MITKLALLGFLLVLVPPLAAAPRSYGLDEDPVRLGQKALDEGQLDEARAHFQKAADEGYKVERATRGLAEVAVRAGSWAEAESFYRASIAARPLAEARAGLGLLLLRLARRDEAEAELDRALAEKPGLWEAEYGRALLLLERGRTQEARELLASGRERRGAAEGEDLYRHGMALVLAAEGDLAGAETEALGALSLDPADARYAVLVADLSTQRGVPALAIDAWEQALHAPGVVHTPPMLEELAALYRRVGRFQDARDRLLQAVELDSTYAPALRELADLFAAAKQHDRAAGTWLRYVQLRPDDVDAQLGLAASCAEIGNHTQALAAARTAMALDSTRADVRFALFRAGIRSPDAAAREEAARLYVALPPDAGFDAKDLVALAAWQREAKQWDTAREALARAHALTPEEPDVPFELGMLELAAGRPDSAAVSFERAVALRGDAPHFLVNLGIARLRAGQNAPAVSAFRAGLALNPEHVYGRLLLAQALAVSDSIQAAESEYRNVLEREPQNAGALRGLGFCQIRQGRYADAADTYAAATRAEPGNAEAWVGKGNALLGLGDLAGAEQAFEHARKIEPENRSLRKGLELLQQAKESGAGSG
ncbi:MAG: tetratricopeptide repeat protein [Candidatus Eiseniibacteriota bacterium]